LRRGRIVHHHGARTLDDPAEHGVIEIAAVGSRRGPPAPQFPRQAAIPLPVVVHELFGVGVFVQAPQQKMVEHRVVQHHHSGRCQRALVNAVMERVVT
jgi:hypothetical protein